MESIRPSRDPSPPHPRPGWFSGPVDVQELREGEGNTQLEILAVYFDAGARTKPHTHATDQLLSFLEGEGILADSQTRRSSARAGWP